MKRCKDIEPLLYMHRDGERTPEEDSLVHAHLAGCPECSALHRRLHELHEHLASARTVSVPPLAIADLTLAKLNGNEWKRTSRQPWVQTLFDWTRPALATAVAVLFLFLLFQETRDALKTSALEQRLRDQGSGAQIWNPLWTLPGSPAFETLLNPQAATPSPDPFPAMAAVGEEQLRALGSLLSTVVGSSDDLFVRLSKRYPNVARIRFDDGLNEQERRILATEGQLLLRDLQNMISQGVN
jgi:hypothetical protein